MAKTLKEDVFIGTDNSFTIKISQDSVPVDLASVSRMKLWLGTDCTYEVDSQAYPLAFNWITPTSGGVGDTEFKLGLPVEALAIPAGNYKARWKLFSALTPNGVVVVDPSNSVAQLRVRVLASCEAV